MSVSAPVAVMTEKAYRSELSPVSFLRRSACVYPDKVAVVHGERRTTYRELEERCNQLASALRGAGVRPGDRVACLAPITREDGTDLHPSRVSEAFDRLVKRCGLPRVRLHDLRHGHCTLALAAGVHPKVVQERLGHSSVAFTLDRYSHVVPAMQEDAATTVARLVGLD